MRIRKTIKKDLKALSEIYEKTMSKNFVGVGEHPITKKEYFKILNKNLSKANMFVLEDNSIEGFVWYNKDGNEFNIEEIFVLDKGKGYGKMLMEFVLKDAKNKRIRKINGDVHINNKKAILFLKRFGFTERTVELSKDM